MKINRTACVLLSAGAMSCAATESLGAVAVEGVCQGRLMRGGIVNIGENFSGAVSLPDDGTTGLFDVMNSHLFAAGIANSHLSANAMSSSAGSIGASNAPAQPNSFQALGSGDAKYQDELGVTSQSLPIGTPVTLQFSYQLAFFIFGESSVGLGGGDANRALIRANVSAQMRSLGQMGDIETIQVAAVDNNAFIDTGSSTSTTAGLFTGAQHLDVLVNAEVGGTINFSLTTDADAIIGMTPISGANQTASATCQIAIAYGASGLTTSRGVNDLVITSTRTGQEFPAASQADANAADAVLPPSVLPPVCCQGNAAKETPGQVNFADINAVLSNWLGVVVPPLPDGTTIGDANCDGVIDFVDINEVLANWLDPC